MKKLLILCVLFAAVVAQAQTIPAVTLPANLGNSGASSATSSRGILLCDPTQQNISCAFQIPVRFDSPNGQVAYLTADFTDASSASQQTITGLSLTLPANSATNWPFTCEIMYSQATAAVSSTLGIQAATFNPTRIDAQGLAGTSASAVTLGNLANLNTTTATAIVTFTPSAITTVWNARLSGVIQNAANSSQQTINFTVSQSTAADLITIKAGSWCRLGF